jgi:hypothetical protein
LLLNGSLLGRIATASADAKSFLWSPLNTLTYAFIYPYNAFQIELEAQTENGQKLVEKSKGPFSISLSENLSQSSESAKVVNGSGDLNNDGSIDFIDMSVLMSNFKKDEIKVKSADLNDDVLVNDIDIWLLQELIGK